MFGSIRSDLKDSLGVIPWGETLSISTRSGVRDVQCNLSGYQVDMGCWRLDHGEHQVRARNLDVQRPGPGINVANAHAEVALASDEELDGVELVYIPIPGPLPDGAANVEFVVPPDRLATCRAYSRQSRQARWSLPGRLLDKIGRLQFGAELGTVRLTRPNADSIWHGQRLRAVNKSDSRRHQGTSARQPLRDCISGHDGAVTHSIQVPLSRSGPSVGSVGAVGAGQSAIGWVTQRSGVLLSKNPGVVERLVKSTERVRDLAEVFTPAATVQAMLDQFPVVVWASHPSATFLEPACGDGNFLIAVLERKLNTVTDDYRAGRLAAGATVEALAFHGLEAIASIYAVDISIDNVVGGKTGHEVGARERLMAAFASWYALAAGSVLHSTDQLAQSAWWAIEHNIQIGNMLRTNPDGKDSGRDKLPVVEYTWDPRNSEVVLARTTLGDLTVPAPDELSIFGAESPIEIWHGPATSLHRAKSPITNGHTAVPSRNGRSSTR